MNNYKKYLGGKLDIYPSKINFIQFGFSAIQIWYVYFLKLYSSEGVQPISQFM